MIGNVKIMNGCAPLGGWWTDFKKNVQDGLITAAQILALYQQGRIDSDQYFELQKIQAEAAGKVQGETSSKTTLYIAGAVALVLVALIVSKK